MGLDCLVLAALVEFVYVVLLLVYAVLFYVVSYLPPFKCFSLKISNEVEFSWEITIVNEEAMSVHTKVSSGVADVN